ncbi:cytosol nonspecific dipeptidase [Histophilus somni]|uniref:Cytosol non-specific dipeptidase n=1 Tax=Histophilus somni TaxID=731 RepID=A0A9Q6Z1K1_HISSO|nr:aminoacyl-histidine dipeptidase [Histophilus somni]ARU64028.1 cytosol nonspecific dipeptidase [Histophilus somni]ARU65809.1 cytosol nonspecific dipeptidase [Histophilus somni]ARU67683.1 cytosol nonspecific dipeptidase [Histophilus somni]ARU69563.1 cytosol nonspecific dipeptidase [Histophilus somni]ARU71440.1 cytosol nonspecific dipeptidase [Histophilus somni]
MSDLQSLQPKLLWQWFDQICAIPHPSYKEEQLAQFIINWAKTKGFFAERDEVGNVLIRKPATVGMENRKPVVLQAHLDMVPQANEGTNHNFDQDPILPYIDGDWVKAKGTTLGADNGIGMASALAVLESNDIAHPELEVLLTMTEERGMEGAIGLRPNWLRSEILINTDTEENGEIYIGCAGGENADLELPIEYQVNNFEHCYQVVLKGLRGGHSGVDIHTGRANAIKVLLRFLAELQQNQPHFDFTLANIRGGSIRNAIPRESVATLVFNGDITVLQSAVQKFADVIKAELALTEPNLIFTLEKVEKPQQVFSSQCTKNIIHCLNVLPNGVVRNSDVIENVVETSLSIGVLKTEDNFVRSTMLVRSLIESGKSYVASLLKSLASLAQGNINLSGDYPGWEPQSHSDILDLTKTIYAQVLGTDPEIKVIHAGLECGLLKKIYPTIDMVSIGPTIRNAHSPDEKVHIPAVEIYWKVLTGILAHIPSR